MAVIYGDDLANDLSGTAGADSIYGLGGADTLSGSTGNAILGDVVDVLYGGAGNDVYNVSWGDGKGVYSIPRGCVVEDVGQGDDTVNVHINGSVTMYYTDLNVENMNVYGDAAIVWGNSGDEVISLFDRSEGGNIQGREGDDILYGSNFDDSLNGGEGIDGMIGGKGDDFYTVDNRGDIVIEYFGQGVDEVSSTVGIYKLSNNVENLYLDGMVQRGTGNSLANSIESSNDYTKFVNGGGGNDTIKLKGNASDLVIGGSGNDTLQAGMGDDVYRTAGEFGRDEITDVGGDDVVEFDVANSNIWFTRLGDDLNVSIVGTQNGVVVKGWYTNADSRIEEFEAGNGKILAASRVDALVGAMASFVPPSSVAAIPQSVQLATNNLWQ